MVNPTAPITQSEESTAPAEPGILGLTQHNQSFNHSTQQHDSIPTSELNPNALHKRLLQVISPATTTSATGSNPNLRTSSSAPDLTRSDSLGASSVSHAHTDNGATPKFHRHGTDLTVLTVGNGGEGGDGGGINSSGLHGGATTPNAPRPPLLSKKLLEPKVPVGKNPTFKECLRNTVKYSWLNVLLIAVPVAWAMDLSHQSSTVVFVCSFFAIIPLAALLGFATEELALRVGDAFGGLLNATFGNAVELIIAILALIKGELNVVRSSMLGSILSNCLLVMGGAFFAGGLRFHEQGYSIRAAQLNINLLGISVVAIVVPTAFHSFLEWGRTQSLDQTDDDVLQLSRGICFILLFTYASYLVFQLWTHSYLYVPATTTTSNGEALSPAAMLLQYEGPQPPTQGRVFRIPSWGSSTNSSQTSHSIRSRASSINHQDVEAGMPGEGGEAEGPLPSSTHLVNVSSHDPEKGGYVNGLPPRHVESPKLSIYFALGLLVVVTVLTGVTAEFLVSSISGLTATGNISTEFVALILLPVVGNAAEHVTAITVATKNKLDLSLAVAVGSSIQIALFVVPILVLLGWCIGQPLDLFFDPFETLLLFLCICGVNWAIADGRTNWLEGLTLMVVYLIIALTTWYYPGLPANLS
ncbi:uncharacterized protein JCM6883_001191 [Sporobolomyces salmoneus]|uniref:uncharacterized protein n=1 Tax=Sporobolomyces salmoneus TaxID=183962 RepID=UPI003178CE9D